MGSPSGPLQPNKKTKQEIPVQEQLLKNEKKYELVSTKPHFVTTKAFQGQRKTQVQNVSFNSRGLLWS